LSYIGKTPTPAPLTSSDITDGIISESKLGANAVTTGKITDGTIAQADISDQAINEAKMQVSNSPTNGYFLSAQSGNTGGMTWAEAGGGDYVKLSSGTTGSVSELLFANSVFDSNYETHIIELNMASSASTNSGNVNMFYDDASTFSSGFTNCTSISLQMNSSNSSPEMSGGEENNGVMRIATDGWKSNAGQQPIIIECHNMRTAYVKYFYWRALHINMDADQRLIVNYGGGCARTVSTTSSLKFNSQNGWNFSETRYAVYGVK